MIYGIGGCGDCIVLWFLMINIYTKRKLIVCECNFNIGSAYYVYCICNKFTQILTKHQRIFSGGYLLNLILFKISTYKGKL